MVAVDLHHLIIDNCYERGCIVDDLWLFGWVSEYVLNNNKFIINWWMEEWEQEWWLMGGVKDDVRGEYFGKGGRKYSTFDLLGVVMMYYLKLCFGLP